VRIEIDTDTRQVRRDSDGAYRSGAGKRICDHCASRDVCPDASFETLCTEFVPALPFTDETGLDHVANTIRVGRAWTERLRIWQGVALYNSKKREIFGHALVLYHTHGPIVDMLRLHAAANHIMLDTPPNKAPTELGAWMRQNYGPRIIHADTTLTAIYLLRVHSTPLATYQQGMEAIGLGQGRTARSGKAGRE
jgi:hypothetical protein